MPFSVISVKPHLLALALRMCMCNYNTLSPCIFPRLEREMEYSKNIVNSLQEYLGILIDIYMKVNE